VVALYERSNYTYILPLFPVESSYKIYYSASLANLFPASSFTDAEQNMVKPGMFDVQVLYEDSSETMVNSCSIIIGEQQTKQ
jgi:hypothetical protein